jgi:hypothetical protein
MKTAYTCRNKPETGASLADWLCQRAIFISQPKKQNKNISVSFTGSVWVRI